MTAMLDTFKELKALEDLTDNLRFLFRYEEQLIQEGWYTESEFLQAILAAIEEWQKKQKKEWKKPVPLISGEPFQNIDNIAFLWN